jgi:hypothetical protein
MRKLDSLAMWLFLPGLASFAANRSKSPGIGLVVRVSIATSVSLLGGGLCCCRIG